MTTRHTSILSPLFNLSFAGLLAAQTAVSAAPAPDRFSGLKLCQLGQMETVDLGKIKAPASADLSEPEAKAGAGRSVKAAPLDVKPVMSWIDPRVKLKAVLVCVHGLGLNKSSYTAFGERMAHDGYAVYSMDVRGFGEFQQLPGDRHCDFKKCLEDVCEALRLARRMHPGVPVIVLGESMGGAIAMRVTEEHPDLMDGLISSVPGASRHKQWKSSLQVGLKLITHGANAKVNVGKSVVSQSTENEDLRKKWGADPLARFELTPVELIQFQHFMETNKKNADKITSVPVLMVQGQKDQLVKQEDSDENFSTYGRIKSEHSLVMVKNAEHLIFEEAQFDDDDLAVVRSWIDAHNRKTLSNSASESPSRTAEE